MQNQKIESCSHCNEKIITPILSPRNPNLKFCCHGCCNVYEILEENNLEDYYKYRDTSQTSSVRLSNQKFKYIDDQKFEVQYVKVIGDQKIMKFYLEGVHCLACLWLLEKLPLLSKEIYASELDMGKSVLKITLAKEAKFSQVAKLIESLGYPPHPISDDMNTEKLKRKEDHQDLIRIVISFFCAGNIMLMAFSIYAGATNIIKTYFDYISAILFLPICLYSAIPFYKSALGSLKTKTISIDIPIVIALIGGSLWSYYNTLRSNEHIYFDTLAILVFLLLTTRFILKKTQQKGLAASEITNFFTNIATTKIEDGKEIEIHARYLDIDDTIKVHPGETIPCDGVIKNGNTSLNTSLLTGEVIPQTVKVGDTVYSGTTNLESDIIITVKKDYKHSKLGKILEDVERGWKQKSKIITKTDNIAKKFLLIVLGISILTFLYFTLVAGLLKR